MDLERQSQEQNKYSLLETWYELIGLLNLQYLSASVKTV